VLLGKEEKKTLCLHHQRKRHYSFAYKIWAGKIAWKERNFLNNTKNTDE
jgi:hypothetical protein